MPVIIASSVVDPFAIPFAIPLAIPLTIPLAISLAMSLGIPRAITLVILLAIPLASMLKISKITPDFEDYGDCFSLNVLYYIFCPRKNDWSDLDLKGF